MVTVVGATAYWFVAHRRAQKLAEQAEQMTEWPVGTLPLPEGIAEGKLVTRCKNGSLDYRFTLRPVEDKDLPIKMPSWLETIPESVPASGRAISIPRAGLTSFPSELEVREVQRRALLIAGRNSVTKFTISLIDKDHFRISTWDIDTFSQSVHHNEYSAEGNTVCSPETYIRAKGWDPHWKEAE